MIVFLRITVWPFRDGVQWTDPSMELTHSITLSQAHPHKPRNTCHLTLSWTLQY